MSELEWHRTSGGPDPEQERVIIAALEKLLKDEQQALVASRWKLEGRAASSRRGASETRHSVPGKAWVRAENLGWSSAGPSIRIGRGDTK